MTELKEYVDALFRRQPSTPEVQDLKEEILSNMAAKRDDLIAQGYDEATATEQAKESLSSVDALVDGAQLTDLSSYHKDCAQTVFLNCILFWIFSLPLLFTGYAPFSYLGLLLTVLSGVIFCLGKQQTDTAAFLSIPAAQRRRKIAWIIWGLFFAVCIGITAGLTFASDIWFGRPLSISGPYQLATVAVQFYLPLLTILIPITFSSFFKLLIKNRKEPEHE